MKNELIKILIFFMVLIFVSADSQLESGSVYRGNFLRTGEFETEPILKSPQIKWKFDTKTGKFIEGQPIISNNIIYFGSSDQYFYAVDSNNGKLKWKFKSDGFISESAAVGNGKVVFATENSKLYVLDTKTGKLLWKKDQIGGLYCKSTPTIYENVIYIGSTIQSEFEEDRIDFTGFDLETGELVWTYPIRGSNTAPIISEGKIYFNDEWSMVCVDIATKKLIWKTKLDQWIDLEAVLYEKYLLVNDIKTGLKALDKNTGKLLWQVDYILKGNFCVTNNRIYFSNSISNTYYLFCLNLYDGKIIWKSSLKSGVGKLLVVKNYLYGSSANFTVNCFNLQDSSIIWSYQIASTKENTMSLLIFNSSIYVGSNKGILYALQ